MHISSHFHSINSLNLSTVSATVKSKKRNKSIIRSYSIAMWSVINFPVFSLFGDQQSAIETNENGLKKITLRFKIAGKKIKELVEAITKQNCIHKSIGAHWITTPIIFLRKTEPIQLIHCMWTFSQKFNRNKTPAV